MHLSLFSDTFLSDRLDDSGAPAETTSSTGQAHRDGLLRGLVLMGVFGLLIGLAMISGAVHSADADAAPFARGRIPLSVTDWIAEHHGMRALQPAMSLQTTGGLRQ